MWRYLAGGSAALLLLMSGFFLSREMAASQIVLPQAPVDQAAGLDDAGQQAPKADERTKEARRFDRLDKDRNGKIGAGEFLASRRKTFDKLDTDADGKISFEEYAVKTVDRFGKADKDKSGVLDRTEFAATKPIRKAKPKLNCPPEPQSATGSGDSESAG